MNDVIRLRECGTGFVSRREGEAVRARLVARLEQLGKSPDGASMTIDFDGVEFMTPSFADECFAKFARHIGEARLRKFVRLVNANKAIRTLVNAVVAVRLQEGKAEQE